jgi:hypothetical protein
MNLLKEGDRLLLSGGYDMEPKWLNGSQGYGVTVLRYFPGQNAGPALLVYTDEPILFEEVSGRHLVLELRWEGDEWENKGVTHVELCQECPEEKRWQERKQGKWVESHASYEKI